MSYDVVIAGAGPVGLLLASELRLAGVSVLVFERLADPNLPIKNRCDWRPRTQHPVDGGFLQTWPAFRGKEGGALVD
jgi:2-polyprenyl-6-methoxyphenol hydroxylase-like FAD-dependent oxidoreductase